MMNRLAILATFALAGCLGDTTVLEGGGVAPAKGLSGAPDYHAQILEEMGLPASGTTLKLVSVHDNVTTYEAVTTFAGGGGESCEVDALDAEILASRCADLMRE